MDTNSIMDKKMAVAFAAIDKDFEISIPQPTETESVGRNYVTWGSNNIYPEYLYSLFLDVSTLKTIINGTADFVAGDDATCNIEGFNFEVNTKGDTMRELISLLARDYLIYGGFAVLVIRNKVGDVRELYYTDFRYLRSSKKNDLFWYSEEYGKKYARHNKTIIYPKFVAEAKDVAASILYVTNSKSSTYPIPQYSGAIKACEIERQIDEFHLSSIGNGFGGSYLINFLNGIPDDETKAEIEKNVTEKWCGASNAGRVMLNFANSKDTAATVEKLEITDFSDKYKAAADRSREQIFCSFRATPALFGLPNATSGFSEQEYKEAFKLYNRTMVRSIQRTITDSIDKIFQTKGSITIKPFSIEVEEDNNTENTVL